ncbi:MAG: L-arabinose isomerase, partial [Sphingobacteriales bacterium]
MIDLKKLQVWFITGTQHLYGEETLKQVADNAQQVSDSLNQNGNISVSVVFKPIVKTTEEIFETLQQANIDENCIGVIT